MAEPTVLRSGDISLDVAINTVASDFEQKFDLDCKGSDVPFMYIPASANVSGVSADELVGRIGLIVDNNKESYTYVVLAQIDDVGIPWGHVSERAIRNLGYSEFGISNNIVAKSNFALYVYPTIMPEWSDSTSVQQQVLSFGIQLGGSSEVLYANNSAGVAIGNSIVNLSDFKLYVISLDRYSDLRDFQSLKDAGVIGVIIEAGYLYDTNHKEVGRYQNPRLSSQIQAAKDANMLYGLYAVSRAKNRNEAKKELKELNLIIRTYSTQLGVWLKPELTAVNSVNDGIINLYYEAFVDMGLTDIVGLYATRDQMSRITWEDFQDSWFLWLIDHVDSMDNIADQFTPEFFVYGSEVN